jgi:hypothetical protein
MVRYTYPSQPAVQQQAALLSALTARTDSLGLGSGGGGGSSSSAAVSNAGRALSAIAAAGASVGITDEAAEALASVVDALFSTIGADNKADNPRRLSLGAEKPWRRRRRLAEELGLVISSAVDDMARGAWVALEAGEAARTIVRSRFNVR